jgi:haloacetate dehalogenase
MLLPGFDERRIDTNDSSLCVQLGGDGPAVLLLHGFPETHIAWRKVAPRLMAAFTVVMADLPGYGDSRGPSPETGRERFSKRSMARALVDAMSTLGFPHFSVVGHDRGARVAYRMALDYPDRIRSVGVFDVIPALEMVEQTTYATARQMANWFWLAQPPPMPEELIGADPRAFVTGIITMWGGAQAIEPEALDEYVRAFRNPDAVRAICEEYRAGDTLDIEHDRQDRASGRRITCPLLTVWVRGGFASQFGDPLSIWRKWADRVQGEAVSGGHFIMEESPNETGRILESFLVETAKSAPRHSRSDWNE